MNTPDAVAESPPQNKIHYTGTTEECLVGFVALKRDKLNQHHYAARNELCDLLKIARPTGKNWFFDCGPMPMGVNLLKLQYLLELVGFKIKERHDLRGCQRDLAIMLALTNVPADGVGDYVGSDASSILRWAFNIIPPSEEKASKIAEFCSQKTKEVEEIRILWVKAIAKWELSVKDHSSKPQLTPETVSVASAPVVSEAISVSTVIEVTAPLIKALRPLAARLASSDCSPEDRQRLRELTQDGRVSGLFELSNLLSRLCSERAFNDMKK